MALNGLRQSDGWSKLIGLNVHPVANTIGYLSHTTLFKCDFHFHLFSFFSFLCLNDPLKRKNKFTRPHDIIGHLWNWLQISGLAHIFDWGLTVRKMLTNQHTLFCDVKAKASRGDHWMTDWLQNKSKQQKRCINAISVCADFLKIWREKNESTF